METKEILTLVIPAGAVVLASIISIFKIEVSNLFRKDKTKTNLEDAMRFNSEVDVRLRNILVQFGASRIWIMQFHNGGHFYPTGKSIQKFSMIYEAVSNEGTAIQTQYQNIPISLFSYPLKCMLDKDVFLIEDYQIIDKSIPLGSMVLMDTAKSMYCFALKDLNNAFIGILGLSFNEVTKIREEKIVEMKTYSHAIAGFLMNYLNEG